MSEETKEIVEKEAIQESNINIDENEKKFDICGSRSIGDVVSSGDESFK